ncbi:hypothetical protein E1301_Tti013024 [Triplophysa tibetana]|uniref:LRAT domain-containing protein n=1 Tax=Triplophysa tibetana TaxID=1572043 RepID=A0A5A9NMI4_9TELE|nr:hypothetical protein E1301_Tti013024 [Triplophysa tibetana]
MDNWLTWKELELLMSGKHEGFDIISQTENVNLQAGDLILRDMDSCKWFYHAGIFTEKNEVIEFTVSDNTRTKMCLFSSSTQEGRVCKVGMTAFIKQRKYLILRKKIGIPALKFNQMVITAMESTEKYHFLKNNCLHFALRLINELQGDTSSASSFELLFGSLRCYLDLCAAIWIFALLFGSIPTGRTTTVQETLNFDWRQVI